MSYILLSVLLHFCLSNRIHCLWHMAIVFIFNMAMQLTGISTLVTTIVPRHVVTDFSYALIHAVSSRSIV